MTIDDTIKKRLRFKTVSIILIGVALTIFVGVILFLLPIFIGLEATYWTIGFLIFAIGLPSNYFLKTSKLFIANTFLVGPISPLITVFLNSFYIKYVYLPNVQSFLTETVFILLVIFLLVSIGIWAIMRICTGYEMWYDPVIHSYTMSEEMNKNFLKKLTGLLSNLGADLSYAFLNKEIGFIEFSYFKDKYIACLRVKESQETELNFLTFRLLRDTIIPPKSLEVDFFFTLFDAATQMMNQKGMIPKIEQENKPHFLQETERMFVSFYGASYIKRLRFAIPLPSLSGIKSWYTHNSNIVNFVAGILATIFAGLILRFVFGI